MTRPVGFGFLGAGAIARHLGPVVHAVAEAELVAGAARDLDRAAALGGARAFDDYAAVLGDDDVEVVYIALANHQHLNWALAALRAGKHVLCEKPLALSVAEVDLLIAAASSADRLLVEASFYQWHPRTAAAHSLIAAGAIGGVEHIEAGFCFPGDWGPGGNYRLDPAFGGGAGYDVGCYPASALLWAGGGDGLARLGGDVAARSSYAPGGVDLTTELVVDLNGGITGALRCSIAEPARQWLRITGSGGEINLAGEAFTARDAVLELSQGTGTERFTFPGGDGYAEMVAAVSRAVRGQSAWLVPLAQSRACAAVLEAARASAALGGAPVTLP